jgi:formate dehydrogenase accessory protein FdhD
MSGSANRVRVERVAVRSDGTHRASEADLVAVEEPVEIRVLVPEEAGYVSALTMRTPGHDIDLALGWLVGEGVLGSIDDVVGVEQRSRGDGLDRSASVSVRLKPGVAPPIGRGFAISSACGVCGADSIAVVQQRARWDVAADRSSVTAEVLTRLPDALREQQATFRRTGGLHAAGLFTADGSPVVVREDVGRHNAVDKVVGFALREGLLPLRGHVLQVSGRSSMELVYKAILAGVPVLSAVSAPSSMAVDLARAQGLTLAGFVRGETFTLYSRADRVR